MISSMNRIIAKLRVSDEYILTDKICNRVHFVTSSEITAHVQARVHVLRLLFGAFSEGIA
jgi:hypothetical protein